MNGQDQLLFGRVLCRFLLLIILELLLVVSDFGGFWDGQGYCRRRGMDSMVDEPLFQSLGIVKGSGV